MLTMYDPFSLSNSLRLIMLCIIGCRFWNVGTISESAPSMMLIHIPVSSRPTSSCFTGVYSQDAWPPFLLFVGVETCT